MSNYGNFVYGALKGLGAHGGSASMIAQQLGISVSTARKHLNDMVKMGQARKQPVDGLHGEYQLYSYKESYEEMMARMAAEQAAKDAAWASYFKAEGVL